MRGFEGVLFPKDMEMSICDARRDTCIWVSDLVGAETESGYGKRLMKAFSTRG